MKKMGPEKKSRSLMVINGINGRTILIYSNNQIVMLTQGNAHSYSVPSLALY